MVEAYFHMDFIYMLVHFVKPTVLFERISCSFYDHLTFSDETEVKNHVDHAAFLSNKSSGGYIIANLFVTIHPMSLYIILNLMATFNSGKSLPTRFLRRFPDNLSHVRELLMSTGHHLSKYLITIIVILICQQALGGRVCKTSI